MFLLLPGFSTSCHAYYEYLCLTARSVQLSLYHKAIRHFLLLDGLSTIVFAAFVRPFIRTWALVPSSSGFHLYCSQAKSLHAPTPRKHHLYSTIGFGSCVSYYSTSPPSSITISTVVVCILMTATDTANASSSFRTLEPVYWKS